MTLRRYWRGLPRTESLPMDQNPKTEIKQRAGEATNPTSLCERNNGPQAVMSGGISVMRQAVAEPVCHSRDVVFDVHMSAGGGGAAIGCDELVGIVRQTICLPDNPPWTGRCEGD
jgi:hypothetical protein